MEKVTESFQKSENTQVSDIVSTQFFNEKTSYFSKGLKSIVVKPLWKGNVGKTILLINDNMKLNSLNSASEAESNEFEPRLKSAKNRFQLNAGLNLETLNTISSGTNNI